MLPSSKFTLALPPGLMPPLGLTLLAILGIALAGKEPQKIGKPALPNGFVDLQAAIPTLAVDIRYHGKRNFLGHPVDGYVQARAVATTELAEALSNAQRALEKSGLGLKVFDAYRPQRAVDQFVRWANDPSDRGKKAIYYPRVAKTQLIPSGYIADRSGHSRGSAVDVTLIRLDEGVELDMGSPFDLFDPRSHTDHQNLTPEQKAHRVALQKAMVAQGFAPYPEEWWHFSLENEPYPETYFDFPIR